MATALLSPDHEPTREIPLSEIPAADPRGPIRRVVSVEQTSTSNLTTLDCGHVANLVAHFAPKKPGEECRCYRCGKEGSR